MKNVRIVVTGNRASGATTAANLIAAHLIAIGLTVVQEGDVIVVSGEPKEDIKGTAKCSAETEKLSMLQEAHSIINSDREKTYGDPGKNLRTIAAYWNTHIIAAKSMDVGLTHQDVSGMMILLKQARLANSPNHRDSLVDIAGYVGLQDRIQSSNETPKQ